ncbi:MAG: clan AA aspartic protease [Burkholderiales bacterium]|nr:clan AA aspartic protease [Phycisphaerae bacterium]
MGNSRTAHALLIAGLLLIVLHPHAKAAEPTSEQILKAKQLVKLGQYYVLPGEIALSDYSRAIRSADYKFNEYTRRREAIVRDIHTAEKTIEALRVQNEAETETLQKIGKKASGSYNDQVGIVNAIRKNLREGVAYIGDQQKALQKLEKQGDPGDQYVTAVLRMSEVMDDLTKQYAVLAKDEEVTKAIADLNQASNVRMMLGPSERLTGEIPDMKKLREKVDSATIQFEMGGGVPHVPITINDAVKINVVFDSGATLVTLAPETAAKLTLREATGKKTLRLHTADGKVHECRLVILDSVRIGNFRIENVEAAVLPSGVKGAPDLLGGSFLKNFKYQMDLGARVIKLTQITRVTPNQASAPTEGGPMPGENRSTAVPPATAPTKPESADTSEKIVFARWGGGKKWVDVTDRLKLLAASGKEFVATPEALSADPTPGWKKRLEITFDKNGVLKIVSVAENDSVDISQIRP